MSQVCCAMFQVCCAMSQVCCAMSQVCYTMSQVCCAMSQVCCTMSYIGVLGNVPGEEALYHDPDRSAVYLQCLMVSPYTANLFQSMEYINYRLYRRGRKKLSLAKVKNAFGRIGIFILFISDRPMQLNEAMFNQNGRCVCRYQSTVKYIIL